MANSAPTTDVTASAPVRTASAQFRLGGRRASTFRRAAMPATWRARLVGIGILPAVALVAAACGSSGHSYGSGASSSGTSTGAPATGAATVKMVHDVKLGSILVTSAGRTLYELVSSSGKPLPCAGACASIWPPYVLSTGTKTPVAGGGVGAHLGVVSRSGGAQQVTANGIPLYLYAADGGPGQVNGEGLHTFGGVWWALTPNAQAAKPTSAPSSSSTTKPSSSWG